MAENEWDGAELVGQNRSNILSWYVSSFKPVDEEDRGDYIAVVVKEFCRFEFKEVVKSNSRYGDGF